MEVESDRILEVAKKMAEYDNVSYVACGIGESDVSIQVVAKDTAEIYQLHYGGCSKGSGREKDHHIDCAVDHQGRLSMEGAGAGCAGDL
jgi:hypothetical protein